MRLLTLDDLPAGHVCTYAHWQYSQHNPSPPLHTQRFAELFWVTAGAGLHVINGESRALEAGVLMLVRPEDVHGFSALPEGPPLQFVNFAFRPALWAVLRRRHPELRGGGWFGEREHGRREHHLDPARLERMRHLAADLTAGARDSLSAEVFLAGMAGMLLHAARRQAAGTLPEWLTAACEAIQEPRHFVGGTPEFARLAGCSPEHLAREVRRRLGRTPTDVVNDARLTHAAQQLATTTTPILDIVAECGFENLGHFYKLFHARHGTTPHRYRRHAVAPVDRRSGPRTARRGGF